VGAGKESANPGVPAGKGKTGRGSSLVRKSSSCGGGEGRRREKGNVVSSKTTWKCCFIENNMPRDDDTVGGEVEAPVALVIGRVANEHT
jgi:hypothetical protein